MLLICPSIAGVGASDNSGEFLRSLLEAVGPTAFCKWVLSSVEIDGFGALTASNVGWVRSSVSSSSSKSEAGSE